MPSRTLVDRRWSWSNGHFFFFFAVFFVFFAFFAFLAIFPSVIPKHNASRQSTGINEGYTKITKLILHALKKVNGGATSRRGEGFAPCVDTPRLVGSDGKKFSRGRKTKPTHNFSDVPLHSAAGYLQTFPGGQTMSALSLKADVGRPDGDVGFGPQADIRRNVIRSTRRRWLAASEERLDQAHLLS